jgi:hypothetical protein
LQVHALKIAAFSLSTATGLVTKAAIIDGREVALE